MIYRISALLAFGLLAACANDNDQSTALSELDTSLRPAVRPTQSEFVGTPLPPLEPSYHVVQGNEASKIELESGLTVDIPENAFVNPDGSVHEGEVTLKIVDMTDLRSIVQSGLRMDATAPNGESGPFMSAGMMSIFPVEDVEIGSGKTLTISIPAKNDLNYPLWKLNTAQNEWSMVSEKTDIIETTKSVSVPNNAVDNRNRVSVYIPIYNNNTGLRTRTYRITFEPLVQVKSENSRSRASVLIPGLIDDHRKQVYATQLDDNNFAVGDQWRYYTIATGAIGIPRTHGYEALTRGWKPVEVQMQHSIKTESVIELSSISLEFTPEFDETSPILFKPERDRDETTLERSNFEGARLVRGDGAHYELISSDPNVDPNYSRIRVLPVSDCISDSSILSLNSTIRAHYRADSAMKVLTDYMDLEISTVKFYHHQFDIYKRRCERFNQSLPEDDIHHWQLAKLNEWRYALERFPSQITEADSSENDQTAPMSDLEESAQLVAESTIQFMVGSFGVYNCDRFYNMETAIPISFQFLNEDDELINILTIRLIDQVENAVIDIPLNSWYISTVLSNRKYYYIGIADDATVYYGTFDTTPFGFNEFVELNPSSGDLENFLAQL